MLSKSDIQRLRSLREKKHREEAGLYVVEGAKVVGELLAAGLRFEGVYATPEWDGECTQRVSTDEMARISHYPTPSPVFALGRLQRTPLPAGALSKGMTLALDGLQDPGNVGTLLRVADWFGLQRVLLSPDCADLFSQKVINASMGSFARMTVHTGDLAVALAGCPVPVLGCDLNGEDVHSCRPGPDAVIVIGSEGRGLSPAVKACITRFITIPRLGGAESLNAAIAAAIVCDNLKGRG